VVGSIVRRPCDRALPIQIEGKSSNRTCGSPTTSIRCADLIEVERAWLSADVVIGGCSTGKNGNLAEVGTIRTLLDDVMVLIGGDINPRQLDLAGTKSSGRKSRWGCRCRRWRSFLCSTSASRSKNRKRREQPEMTRLPQASTPTISAYNSLLHPGNNVMGELSIGMGWTVVRLTLLSSRFEEGGAWTYSMNSGTTFTGITPACLPSLKSSAIASSARLPSSSVYELTYIPTNLSAFLRSIPRANSSA